MPVILMGFNQKTASVEVRERFTYSDDQVPSVLQRLHGHQGVEEIALISTCNRTEVYAVTQEPGLCRGSLLSLFSQQESPGHPDFLYLENDLQAVKHLFQVSSGLDSLVLGENQILGQVRTAFTLAQAARTTGPVLEKLFPWALRVGKMARSQTRICQGAASVAAAAVELAQMIFDDLKGRRVLLLGAGKMTQASLGLLRNAGVEQIRVVNRTLARAEELAARCGGEATPFEDLDKALAEVDVMIASTGAPHFVVNKSRLAPVMHQRRGRPLLLVDIAVPRDIEPSCQDLDNVYLYNIDDLQGVVAENLARRQKEVQKVLQIVDAECKEFSRYLDSRKANQAIRMLRESFEEVRQSELLKHRGSLTHEEMDRLESFSNVLLNKLLHNPMMQLKKMSAAGVPPEELERALEILGIFPKGQHE
ncbi:MAG: glutamyl-tRNA reductase [Vulcanimicrobiota bacterium]